MKRHQIRLGRIYTRGTRRRIVTHKTLQRGIPTIDGNEWVIRWRDLDTDETGRCDLDTFARWAQREERPESAPQADCTRQEKKPAAAGFSNDGTVKCGSRDTVLEAPRHANHRHLTTGESQ